MFRIFDRQYRRVIGEDFATCEDAEKRLAELIEADPNAERVLSILSSGPIRIRGLSGAVDAADG